VQELNGHGEWFNSFASRGEEKKPWSVGFRKTPVLPVQIKKAAEGQGCFLIIM